MVSQNRKNLGTIVSRLPQNRWNIVLMLPQNRQNLETIGCARTLRTGKYFRVTVETELTTEYF